ncbi:hypothetical protein NJ69_06470 [Pseudomonas parafulva]|nr:hypothetical protein NJ69_06470 [Pseudomonas parafulva]
MGNVEDMRVTCKGIEVYVGTVPRERSSVFRGDRRAVDAQVGYDCAAPQAQRHRQRIAPRPVGSAPAARQSRSDAGPGVNVAIAISVVFEERHVLSRFITRAYQDNLTLRYLGSAR